MNAIRAENLAYATPTGRLLQKGLGFTLNSGQMLLISGSNGTGKSTLLRALLGQFPLLEGKVSCHVEQKQMEYIPQLENTEVHLPLTLRDVLNISQKTKPSMDRVLGYGLLDEQKFDSAWNTASGGERKRTLLTRALLRNPRMLIFDEPMNHLDKESRHIMIKVMADYLKKGKEEMRAIVMVCHQGLCGEERDYFDVIGVDLDRPMGGMSV